MSAILASSTAHCFFIEGFEYLTLDSEMSKEFTLVGIGDVKRDYLQPLDGF